MTGIIIFTFYWLLDFTNILHSTVSRVSNTCVQMPDSGLFRAFRLVFWLVSHPTRPLRNPRTEQNCLRPRKRHSVLQTVFYLALENFLFRSVMKLLGFSRIDVWCSWRSICWNTVNRTSMKAFQSIFKSKINRLVVLFGWGTLVSWGTHLSHRK